MSNLQPAKSGFYSPQNILAADLFQQTPVNYNYDPLNIRKPVPSVPVVTAAASDVSTIVVSENPYKYSANLTQGVIAAIIAKMFSEHKMDHSILIGFLVLLSSAVPPSGIFGILGDNEKLNETLLATFIGGAILKAVAGGNYIKRAGTMLLIDAASMALTNEFYTAFILGGNNLQQIGYRGMYPEGNMINRAFLG